MRHQPLRRVFVAVTVQWWGQKCLLLWIRIVITVDWPTTVFYQPLQSITHPFTNRCLNCRPWSYIFLSCCTRLSCKLNLNTLCCFSELLISAMAWSLVFARRSWCIMCLLIQFGKGVVVKNSFVPFEVDFIFLPHVPFFLCCNSWISKQTLWSLVCPTTFNEGFQMFQAGRPKY